MPVRSSQERISAKCASNSKLEAWCEPECGAAGAGWIAPPEPPGTLFLAVVIISALMVALGVLIARSGKTNNSSEGSSPPIPPTVEPFGSALIFKDVEGFSQTISSFNVPEQIIMSEVGAAPNTSDLTLDISTSTITAVNAGRYAIMLKAVVSFNATFATGEIDVRLNSVADPTMKCALLTRNRDRMFPFVYLILDLEAGTEISAWFTFTDGTSGGGDNMIMAVLPTQTSLSVQRIA